MNSFLLRVGFSACCVFSFIGTTKADIAPEPLTGEKNLAIKGAAKTNVAMVDEVVKLRISPTRCQVDVVFTMKNTGSQAESIQVGFPTEVADDLKDFRAFVDEKPVVVKVEAVTPKKDPEDTRRDYQPRSTYWKLWPMQFPPDELVTLAVSYWSKPSRPTTTLELHEIEQRQPSVMKGRSGVFDVRYILTSGSHWAGPIGRCRIETTFDGLTTENLAFNSPHFERDKAQITRDQIVWDLTDFEPHTNLTLRITPKITRSETKALIEKALEQDPDDVTLTDILADYFYATNQTSKADQLLLALLNRWPDQIVIWGPNSERDTVLRPSVALFRLIFRRTTSDSHGFHHPKEFAPVIERIVRRVQNQLQLAPEKPPETRKLYAEQIKKILAWCEQQKESD